MSICITGAAGKLGSLVCSYLLERVHPSNIIACAREPEQAVALAGQGIEVRHADYDQPETLNAAFAGVSKLIFISSSHRDDTVRLRQHAHVVEAAKQAGVKHILYTGFAFPGDGTTPPHPLHLATERAIAATGLPYTFLRNALYLDFLASFDLEGAVVSGEWTTAPGEWTFNAVSRNDLAQAIAAVAAEPGPRHLHRTYELTANRAWTFQDAADALSRLAGKPVLHRESAEARHWLYGYLQKIDVRSTSPDLAAILGRPLSSLEDGMAPLLEHVRFIQERSRPSRKT
ncbi:NmrA family NAD(P)-binding protein [Paenibacillus hodogayensis]|uniref:NmrA family NAD(P)-binding protein n=1 Tax=Paenibacillus hodogayensis TaxID=279208 RepID=A0ABV5VYJ1_9BACL